MIATVALMGCEADEVSTVSKESLPGHTTEVSSLAPRKGSRVQVNVEEVVTDEECRLLIEAYSDEGEPDGQVSVHMPSAAFNNRMLPFCVENFDGDGISFNRTMFGQPEDE